MDEFSLHPSHIFQAQQAYIHRKCHFKTQTADNNYSVTRRSLTVSLRMPFAHLSITFHFVLGFYIFGFLVIYYMDLFLLIKTLDPVILITSLLPAICF